MGNEWFYRMDAEGETPLSRAIKSGHLAITELMLRQKTREEQDEGRDESLIHRAAYWGLEKAVRKLIGRGADPSERDSHGETPLHKAARLGHVAAVKALVDAGTDIDAANDLGLTSLHWVALNGCTELALVLVDRGADINSRDRFTGGLTPFAMANLMGYEELAECLGRNGGTW